MNLEKFIIKVLQQINDGIAKVNKKGHIAYFNGSFELDSKVNQKIMNFMLLRMMKK